MDIPAARIYFPEADRKELVKQIDEILESGQLTLGKCQHQYQQKHQIVKSMGFMNGIRIHVPDQ